MGRRWHTIFGVNDSRSNTIRNSLNNSQATPDSGISLLFPADQRPAVQDIARLVEGQHVETSDASAQQFAISHRPKAAEGWLELLANGLTFDLSGLAPDAADALPEMAYQYGMEATAAAISFEAITLRPSAHLAGGGNLLPVVRSMAGVAAALVALPNISGICWRPARSLMGPAYFARVIDGWLAGGAFPALGLTALARDLDGGLRSEGLSFFTGQELRIEPLSGASSSQDGKIAVRLIHSLVGAAAVTTPCEFTGPEGERLRVEPSGNGRFLRIWRPN